MAMDRIRRDAHRTRRRRQWVASLAGVLTIAVLTMIVRGLEPAPASLDRETVFLATVKRGEMLRQVRGHGRLVPVESRWIPAQTRGRIDRIAQPIGARVEANTVIVVLSNPEVVQTAVDAEAALARVRSELASLQLTLGIQELERQSDVTSLEAELTEASLRLDADHALAEKGLLSNIQKQLSEQRVRTLETKLEFARRRLELAAEANSAQLEAKRAEVEQHRTRTELRNGQQEALMLRAGMAGVLQDIAFEVGEDVGPGTNVALVAEPSRLRAEIRIPASQAQELTVGLPAHIDLSNTIVDGQVARIDPNVRQGAVMVDIQFVGDIPDTVRPDLDVDGRIDLELLKDVLFVDRPATGGAHERTWLFRLRPDSSILERTEVRFGRVSVRSVEIVEGLQEGDQVIVSDMHRYRDEPRIQFD